MQRIQNQVAKLIMNRDRCESSTSTMRQLHWLPISFRCKYKVLLLVYRCMNSQAQEYLQQKLSLKNPVWITCSATERDILQIPYNKRRTLAECGFSSAGPKLWNSLPLELQTAPTVSIFKELQKLTFLKFVTIYNYVLYIYTAISYS